MDDRQMEEPSDTALATAWAAGDERAFDRIVARHAALVFNRCRIALGAADADDASQAVFLVLARKADQAAASPVLVAWLLKVAEFVVRNAQRDRRRRATAERGIPPQPPAAEPTMAGIKDHLDACLAELPAKEREAVTLHHLGGCTLAEVAHHTRSGVSTVHDRVHRGLERLRALLAQRGVALGATALVSALAAEAQAGMPPAAAIHLRELAPAHRGAGTTAAPSERAQRWSRRPFPMTPIAIAAAGLVLAAGALLHLLPSVETSPAPAVARTLPTAGPATTPALAAAVDLDPLPQSDQWLVLRVNDLGRVLAAMEGHPESILLRKLPHLASFAGLRNASVIATPPRRGPGVPPRPGLSGVVRCSDAGAPLLGLLTDPATGPVRWMQMERDGDGWRFASMGGTGRMAVQGAELRLRLDPGEAIPPAVAALAERALDPDVALDIRHSLDRHCTGWYLQAEVRVAADGLRLRFAGPAEDAFAPFGRPHPVIASAPVDRSRLAQVPAEALAAALVELRPGSNANGLFAGFVAGVNQSLNRTPGGDGRKELDAWIGRQRGTVVGWLTPGSPLPVATFALDVAEAEARDLFAILGLAPDANGTAMALLGPVLVSVGWSAGRLVATTDPAGLPAAGASGGFAACPEVVDALAALPAEASACVVLRPAALLDRVMPMLPMLDIGLSPQELRAYQARLRTAGSFGLLAASYDQDGRLVGDARGMLVLLAAGILAGRFEDLAHLLQVN